MKTPACGEEVTKEWLSEILSQYESKSGPKTTVSVTSFEINPGVKHGENFSSQLLKITVKARLSSDNGAEKTFNLVAKFLQGNSFQREVSKVFKGPLKEILAYSDVIPALNEFQATAGDGTDSVDIPGYVYGVCKRGEYVLVMEDIRAMGYMNNDKRKGLSLNQMLLAIEKLATLHSVSYAYHKRHNLLENFPDFKPHKGMPKQATSFIFNMFDVFLDGISKTKYNQEVVEKIRRNRATFRDRFLPTFKPENHKISCLCHGDYWNNNFMFKAETPETLSDPEAIMLVDWGNPQWYSPIVDVQYVMHTSTTLEFRKSHKEQVLQRYHSKFTEVATKLGAPVSFWTYEAFKSEYESLALYGSMMGAAVTTITLSSAGEKVTKERASASRVDSSTLGWDIGSRMGRAMAPIFITRAMSPLFRLAIRKFFLPFFEEMKTGDNAILERRVFDLLDDAEANGLFDV